MTLHVHAPHSSQLVQTPSQMTSLRYSPPGPLVMSRSDWEARPQPRTTFRNAFGQLTQRHSSRDKLNTIQTLLARHASVSLPCQIPRERPINGKCKMSTPEGVPRSSGAYSVSADGSACHGSWPCMYPDQGNAINVSTCGKPVRCDNDTM